MDFMKYSSFLTYSKNKLKLIQNDIESLTNAEGFDAHLQAFKVRLDEKK